MHPYWLWEDYKNGMYEIGTATDEKIQKSIDILSDCDLFWDAMCQMEIDWKYCFETNLTNTNQNRRAWLGQAACSYCVGNEFNVTIMAWNALKKEQQDSANETANNMIKLYEAKNGKNISGHECSYRCERTIDMDF